MLPRAYQTDFKAGLWAGLFEGLTVPFILVVARQLGAPVWQVALLASVPFYGNLLALFWASRQKHFASPLAFVAFATGVTRVLFLSMAWVTGPVAFVICACMARFLGRVHGPAPASASRDRHVPFAPRPPSFGRAAQKARTLAF